MVAGDHVRIAPDVKLGRDVKIHAFVNLYGCEIGDETKIGTFVEIQKGAKIGSRVKISSHTFICEGVTIEDEVFIGHSVVFINDKYPRATNEVGGLQTAADWQCIPTLVKRGASIGSNATILCGVTIGEDAIVGAGSVVTHNVPPRTIVVGNPARVIRTAGLGQEGDHERSASRLAQTVHPSERGGPRRHRSRSRRHAAVPGRERSSTGKRVC